MQKCCSSFSYISWLFTCYIVISVPLASKSWKFQFIPRFYLNCKRLWTFEESHIFWPISVHCIFFLQFEFTFYSACKSWRQFSKSFGGPMNSHVLDFGFVCMLPYFNLFESRSFRPTTKQVPSSFRWIWKWNYLWSPYMVNLVTVRLIDN